MAQYIERLDRVAYPVIALRGLVVFPGIDTSFDVARKRSIKAVEMAIKADNMVFLVTQKDINDEDPVPSQLYKTGVVCKIKQSLRLPDKSYRLVVEGISRAETVSYFELESGARSAEVITKNVVCESDFYTEAHTRTISALFDEYARYTPRMSDEVRLAVHSISECGFLADYIAANILKKYQDKEDILETADPIKRAEKIEKLLNDEIEISKYELKINSRVQAQMDRQQREYYLREQIKVLKNELNGTEDYESDELPFSGESDELEDKIKKADMPDEIRQRLLNQASKLSMLPYGSSESALLNNYIETCLEIPWNIKTNDSIDINKAKKVLDADHEGLEKIKERIIEYLAAKKLGGRMKGQILCLVGAPGVGKTSIAASIAKAMNKKYVRISLGGVRDEADIRGHRKTYIGSMPGRIIEALMRAGSMNPLILLDEIDKLTRDSHGDPASALLEALDSEQNHSFRDHFIEMPVDLSGCMFIATANELDTIPSALIDRMEIIKLTGYTESEKIAIAKKHLIPKQMKEHSITNKNLKINDGAIIEIIRKYTREQGVRNLEREISRICRKCAKNVVEGTLLTKVSAKDIKALLGKEKILPEDALSKGEIGVVNGLAWTLSGGEMLKVEASAPDGTGKLELTGSLGDVMKESCKAALTYIRTNAEKLGIKDKEFYKNKDIHIHFPEGAIPKDGPSAGVTITTCLVSLLSGRMVRGDVAMTGEISLHGKVMPIGGLREKVNAALRCGIKTVIIPEKNLPDLEEVDPDAIKSIEFIPASSLEKVLDTALI